MFPQGLHGSPAKPRGPTAAAEEQQAARTAGAAAGQTPGATQRTARAAPRAAPGGETATTTVAWRRAGNVQKGDPKRWVFCSSMIKLIWC